MQSVAWRDAVSCVVAPLTDLCSSSRRRASDTHKGFGNIEWCNISDCTSKKIVWRVALCALNLMAVLIKICKFFFFFLSNKKVYKTSFQDVVTIFIYFPLFFLFSRGKNGKAAKDPEKQMSYIHNRFCLLWGGSVDTPKTFITIY